jgi:hypothetical protein
MFALELQRRSDANRSGLMSNAAHPVYAALTELIPNGPGPNIGSKTLALFASQSAADGALPTLFGATAPDARGVGILWPRWTFRTERSTRIRAHSEACKRSRGIEETQEGLRNLTGTSFSSLIAAA